jgi:hypothetical protein
MAGLFSFIESFFFLSIGITFILILLLVYHFKQRLGILEQKSETIVSIVNQLTHEMTYIRPMLQHKHAPLAPPTQLSQTVHTLPPDTCPIYPEMYFVSPNDLRDSFVVSPEFDALTEAQRSCAMPMLSPARTNDTIMPQIREVNDDDDDDETSEEEYEDDDEEEEESVVESLGGSKAVVPEEEDEVEEIIDIAPDSDLNLDIDAEPEPLDDLRSDVASMPVIEDVTKKMNIQELRAFVVQRGLVTVAESVKMKKSDLYKLLD